MKIKKFKLFENNELELKLDERNGFFMFLKLIDELKMSFIITNHYLTTGKYLYFFTTENIRNKDSVIDLFDDAISLKITHKTLEENKDKRLSFYFGVKGYSFEYGLMDDMSSEVYRTGEFAINNKYLTNIKSYKCLIMIGTALKNSNVKNLILLHEIKSHFKNWFPDKGKTTILSENILKKTISKNELKGEKYETILFKYEQWCEKFKWINKVHYYLDEEDNNMISFYIKIKPKKEVEEY